MSSLQTQLVKKIAIIDSGDFNLSAARYLEKVEITSEFKIIKLSDICKITTGKKNVNESNENGEYPFFTCAVNHTFSDNYSFDTEAILIAGNGSVGHTSYYYGKFEAYQRTYVLYNFEKIIVRYLFYILKNRLPYHLNKIKLGNTMPYIKLNMLNDFLVPLPPLEIQELIVKEIEGYQQIIDGCRQVVENYKPVIDIDPSWKTIRLQDTFKNPKQDIVDGPFGSNLKSSEYLDKIEVPIIRLQNIDRYNFINKNIKYISKTKAEILSRHNFKYGDIVMTKLGKPLGKACLVPVEMGSGIIVADIVRLRVDKSKTLREFILYVLNSELVIKQLMIHTKGATRPRINLNVIRNLTIPFPKIDTQKEIVEKLEHEREVIEGNKELIKIYEKKINDKIKELF